MKEEGSFLLLGALLTGKGDGDEELEGVGVGSGFGTGGSFLTSG